MIELLQQLLADRGPELIRSLVGKAGFSTEEAQSFLPAAGEQVTAAFEGDGLDLGALLGGGDATSLVSKLNVGALAQASGIDEAKADAGIGALIPDLLAAFKDQAGGADGLLAALAGGKAGGLLGTAGGLAGKLFK